MYERSERKFSHLGVLILSKKVKILGGLIILINISLNSKVPNPQKLVYGSFINQTSITNIEGKEISIPQEGFVTLLFFFNINHTSHKRILTEFDFLLMNLKKIDDRVKLIGISSDKNEKFKELKNIYNNRLHLVNDTETKLYKIFNYSCGNCIKIIIIDKNCIVRYLSSSLDPIFLREIIRRYINEN
ncbi:MAG: redoxin domain-containing protein [Candidatus Aminicenantes bacterium]|nr:redoxin domain-containing protein [Candidatus Aminicenantes bacterium]